MKYDFISDIHGCFIELCELLSVLGYQQKGRGFVHPDGRKVVFVGDITDRGDNSIEVIQLVSEMVSSGHAVYVPGNHCNKLYRYLIGRPVTINHGLETTVYEINSLTAAKRKDIISTFLDLYKNAPLYASFDDEKVVAAHAGLTESLYGSYSKEAERFVLYGDVTGRKDKNGLPIRGDWAQLYLGNRLVVYGHTPVLSARYVNKTVNIDTGCVFGNALTAFQYPEEKTLSVPSSYSFVPAKFPFDDVNMTM